MRQYCPMETDPELSSQLFFRGQLVSMSPSKPTGMTSSPRALFRSPDSFSTPLSQLWTLWPPSRPRFLPSAVCWHFSLQEVSDDPTGYKSALVISNLESINLLSNRTCYWAQLLLAPLLACFPGLSLQEGTAEPKHLPVMQLTAAIAPDKKSYIIITRREEWV